MNKEQAVKELMGLVCGVIHNAIIYGATEDGDKEAAHNKVREDESVIEAKLHQLIE